MDDNTEVKARLEGAIAQIEAEVSIAALNQHGGVVARLHDIALDIKKAIEAL